MSVLFSAVLLAAQARAETPVAAATRVMIQVEKILASERGQDARRIAELDKNAETWGREIAPLGWTAVEPLASYARDLQRPPKVRLFATVFLGFIRDPAAFKPLTSILLDKKQDEDVRSAAAQGLATLDAPVEPLRASLCSSLDGPQMPRSLLDEVLIPLSRLGCADSAPLEAVARSFGPRPEGRNLATVQKAALALGRSRGEAAARSLLRLLDYFPARHAARAAVVASLPHKKAELTGIIATASWPLLRSALLSETDDPASAIVLVRLVSEFGAPAKDVLLPLTSHPDAEVLAETAEALARLRCREALPHLEKIAAGAMRDPRFTPKNDRPDPEWLLARIENAVAALRRIPAR